jgi:hypothetical protein
MPLTHFVVSGGAEGNRTPHLLNAIQALSQLSYSPKNVLAHIKSERGVSTVFVGKISERQRSIWIGQQGYEVMQGFGVVLGGFVVTLRVWPAATKSFEFLAPRR